MKKVINILNKRKFEIDKEFEKMPKEVEQYMAEICDELQEEERQIDQALLVLSNVSNSVCPNCGKRGYKTDLIDNSYACKKCLTWWANGC